MHCNLFSELLLYQMSVWFPFAWSECDGRKGETENLSGKSNWPKEQNSKQRSSLRLSVCLSVCLFCSIKHSLSFHQHSSHNFCPFRSPSFAIFSHQAFAQRITFYKRLRWSQMEQVRTIGMLFKIRIVLMPLGICTSSNNRCFELKDRELTLVLLTVESLSQ